MFSPQAKLKNNIASYEKLSPNTYMLLSIESFEVFNKNFIQRYIYIYIFFFFLFGSTYQYSCNGWSTCHSCTTASGFSWKFNTREINYTSAKAEEVAGLCRARLRSTRWTSMAACKRCGSCSPWHWGIGFVPTFAFAGELAWAIFEWSTLIKITCFKATWIEWSVYIFIFGYVSH